MGIDCPRCDLEVYAKDGVYREDVEYACVCGARLYLWIHLSDKDKQSGKDAVAELVEIH